MLACLALSPLIAGCGEDRSNLIPKETSESIIALLDRVQRMADSGQCFEAAPVAAEAQQEIEAMGPEVDPELKRSLIDGVTDLTLLVNDTETCTQSTTNVTEEPTETEEPTIEPDGTTGVTGTTEPEPATPGEQGESDEDQDSNNQGNGNGNGNGDGNGNGNQPSETPAPVPTPNPTPTPPATPTPPSTGPGSGGLGPG